MIPGSAPPVMSGTQYLAVKSRAKSLISGYWIFKSFAQARCEYGLSTLSAATSNPERRNSSYASRNWDIWFSQPPVKSSTYVVSTTPRLPSSNRPSEVSDTWPWRAARSAKSGAGSPSVNRSTAIVTSYYSACMYVQCTGNDVPLLSWGVRREQAQTFVPRAQSESARPPPSTSC